MCLKNASWRAISPVSDSPKRSASRGADWRIVNQVGDHNFVRRLDPHINWRSCKTWRGKCPLGMLLSGSARKTYVAEWAKYGWFLKAKGLNFQTHSLSLTFELPKLTPAQYFSYFCIFIAF